MAVEPSIRIPHRLAEITLRAAAVVPPTVLPEAPSIRIPSFELPRSAVPDLSVPIRLPSIRFWVDVCAVDLDADQVARDDLHALAVSFDRHSRGIVDLNAALGVAQVGAARRIGADQVVADDRRRWPTRPRSRCRSGWRR